MIGRRWLGRRRIGRLVRWLGGAQWGWFKLRWMIGILEVLDGDGSTESCGCEGWMEGGLLDAS